MLVPKFDFRDLISRSMAPDTSVVIRPFPPKCKMRSTVMPGLEAEIVSRFFLYICIQSCEILSVFQ